jgi:hypothetical protein
VIDALHQFRQMRLPTLTLMAAQDRIDAAVRGGDRAQARRLVGDLDALAAGPGSRGRMRRRSAGR